MIIIVLLLFILFVYLLGITRKTHQTNSLDHLFKSCGHVPKKIHLSWKNKGIINQTQYDIISNGIHNLKTLNPDYEFYIYDDGEVEAYLKQRLNPNDYNLIKNKHIVEKIDLWRMILINERGGVYCDIDRLCNIPMKRIIDKHTKCILPIFSSSDYNEGYSKFRKNHEGYSNFSQDIVISGPNNMFLKKYIEMNLERRRKGAKSIYYLGPVTYKDAITWCLFGRTKMSKEEFLHVENMIKKSKYLKTYVETPPYDTVLYQGPKINWDKTQLYNDQKAIRWTTA